MRRLTITGRRLSTLFVASFVLGGAGCATGDTASVGDIDSGFPDVSDDGGDGSSVETGDDADAETGTGKCATDGDCAHDPNGTACDTTTGKCVQCVPSKDWCPDGTYCDAKTNSCQTGCRTSLDCVATTPTDAGAPDAASDTGTSDASSDAVASDAISSDAISGEAAADAGTPDTGSPLVCDPVSHQCVGCTDSSQCPLGALCDVTTNQCYPGCTPTHGCPGTFGCCSGTCVDLNVSVSDCGSCGKACPKVVNGAPACTKGTCVIGTCATGTADCNANFDDGCEVNTTTDPANCGGCKDACSNVHGTGTCAASKCGIKCDPGYSDCDADPMTGCEINTAADVDHCGTCATVCAKLNDTPVCNSGTCAVASCDTGYGNCDLDPANGCETNLNTDVASCGKCNSSCSVANGTPACASGKCAIATCKAGYEDCNTDATDGCETNTAKDATNCGKCGNICSVANGTPTCTGGGCSILACGTNYADCDKTVSNGCESDTRVDKSNCGACGTICGSTNGTASCTGSACQIACNSGYADCDKVNSNGCEIHTAGTDVNNCGGCGTKCAPGNATGKCTAGACGISTCNAGYANCNGLSTDGCEVNTNTDGSNCGGCGTKCSLANASAICSAGGCAIGTCAPGFANCDGIASNGCEVNILSDPNHCGSCPIACSGGGGTPTCTAGTCSVTCSAGFADCNASPGCETQTDKDASNCGGCNNVCNLPHTTLNTCIASTCRVVTCAAGYADCDGNAANGCEVNLTSDPAHCGACPNACNSTNGTPSCVASVCQIACNSGFGNCDGSAANGCEINTQTDSTHCGNCTTVCSTACTGNVTGTSCSAGACGITSCTAGWFNVDKLNPDKGCANGCECQQKTVSSLCNSAIPMAATPLALGTNVAVTANLVAGNDAYYQVSFATNTSLSFHPKIVLTGSNEFFFDVLNAACGASPSCTDRGSASGLQATSTGSTWESKYVSTAGTPDQAGTDLVPGYSNIVVGTANTIWVHVYRPAGYLTTCNNFTLTAYN